MARRLLHRPAVRFACLAPLLLGGCIIPFATPPMRGEVGGATRVASADDRSSSALHTGLGAHYASGTQRDDQMFDVGVGWVSEKTKETTAHGLYVDAALFIDRTRMSRTSIGPRGELWWLPEGKALAAKLRIDTELFATGESDFHSRDRCGSASGKHFGTTAIGVFVEAGRVWAPESSPPMTTGAGDAWVATAGLTLRIPSAAGVWIGVPGC